MVVVVGDIVYLHGERKKRSGNAVIIYDDDEMSNSGQRLEVKQTMKLRGNTRPISDNNV